MADIMKRKLCKFQSLEEQPTTKKLIEVLKKKRSSIRRKLRDREETDHKEKKNVVPPRNVSKRKMIIREESSPDFEKLTAPIDSLAANTRSSLKRLRKICSPEVDEQVSPIGAPTISSKLPRKPSNESGKSPNLGSPAANTRGSLRRMIEREIFSEDSHSHKNISATPSVKSPKEVCEGPKGQIPRTPLAEPFEKKKRGPTKMKGIAINSNGRLQIEFNSRGQPIGKESISLSSFLELLLREIVPITIPDWRKVTKEMKEVLWKSIQARYKPDNIKSVDDWKAFVRDKTSLEFKTNASTSKEAPLRVDVWITAHKKKIGEPVNSKVAEAFGLLEEYKKDISETSTIAVKEDVLSKVLSPGTSSYLRRQFGLSEEQSKANIPSHEVKL
ncbi:hypothetical protein PanWU01x14_351230 [Parasponia andersonii]|uniref:Uncharacterized protein n=1 Tax=Parasponia andersonii TaxID=3476 RepID=A0A2P5AAN5_PARAD|nr:hypothetical protein PanWU01x14_351230 [Parasponia andersonii]